MTTDPKLDETRGWIFFTGAVLSLGGALMGPWEWLENVCYFFAGWNACAALGYFITVKTKG